MVTTVTTPDHFMIVRIFRIIIFFSFLIDSFFKIIQYQILHGSGKNYFNSCGHSNETMKRFEFVCLKTSFRPTGLAPITDIFGDFLQKCVGEINFRCSVNFRESDFSITGRGERVTEHLHITSSCRNRFLEFFFFSQNNPS